MVQHNPWFKFSFVSKLLSCITIPKTEENNIKTRLKLNHNANIYSHFFSNASSRHGLQWKKKCRFTLIVTFTLTAWFIQSHSASAALKTAVLSPFRALWCYLKRKRLFDSAHKDKTREGRSLDCLVLDITAWSWEEMFLLGLLTDLFFWS